jgi:uncharacterized membrane protein
MRNLSNAGRMFYGVAIAILGCQTIYYGDFPYMLIPPHHTWIPGLVVYASGIMLILTGACIVIRRQTRNVSLLLGTVLLLIFCFYFIPYEFIATTNYMHLVEWENAAKELALCSGAFAIAACFPEKNEIPLFRFLGKMIPLGPILFSITMINFGIVHFLYAKEASTLVPSWIPYAMFWTYFAGIALIGSGVAILLKIKVSLLAGLLGTMILTWFIILHIPRVISAPVAYFESEVASAFIALAYSGIAFVIAGQIQDLTNHQAA